MPPVISVTSVHKSFGATHAVQGIDLNIDTGEIYGLVGADGAGKTTFLRLLVGALQPDGGRISIGGFDIESQTNQARELIGYLSQRFSLYEDLTVLENIRFFAEMRGLKQEEWKPRCLEILDFVGLAGFSDRRAGKLSGGMRQKLGLASALVSRPSVLLLDEPTTGVDPLTRQDFWQLILRITRMEKTTVLLTTPYMDEATRCHRIGFVKDGKILMSGSPAALCDELAGRVLEVFTSSPLVLRGKLIRIPGIEDARIFGDRLHLLVSPGKAQSIISILGNPASSGLERSYEASGIMPSLEDVFIAASRSESVSRQ